MKKIVSVLTIISILLLGACANSASEAEAAVNSALTAVQQQDAETANQYFGYNGLIEGDVTNFAGSEFANIISEHLTFEIVGSKVENGVAIVTVDVTNTDLAAVFEVFITDAINQVNELIVNPDLPVEDFNALLVQKFMEAVKAYEGQLVTTTVGVELQKEDGNWKIMNEQDFKNAIVGGMINAINNLESILGEE